MRFPLKVHSTSISAAKCNSSGASSVPSMIMKGKALPFAMPLPLVLYIYPVRDSKIGNIMVST